MPKYSPFDRTSQRSMQGPQYPYLCGKVQYIIAESEPGADIWDLSGLKIKLESIFGVSVDVTTVSALKPDMRDAIMANIAYS